MRDRDAQTFRRERKAAGAGWQIDRLDLAPGGAHERLLAGRPGDRIRPERHTVDPAMLGVGRERLALAVRADGDDLAVIATREDARAIARDAENAARMHRDAL